MHLVIQDRNDPPSTQPFNILGAPLVTLLLTSSPRALVVTGSRRSSSEIPMLVYSLHERTFLMRNLTKQKLARLQNAKCNQNVSFYFSQPTLTNCSIPEIIFLNSFLCRTNQKETLEERVMKNRQNLPSQQLSRRVNKKCGILWIVTFIRIPKFQIRIKKIVYLIVISFVYYQH